jgi:hypothetical protein
VSVHNHDPRLPKLPFQHKGQFHFFRPGKNSQPAAASITAKERLPGSSKPSQRMRHPPERAPLERFGTVLARLLALHGRCGDLYRAKIEQVSWGLHE